MLGLPLYYWNYQNLYRRCFKKVLDDETQSLYKIIKAITMHKSLKIQRYRLFCFERLLREKCEKKLCYLCLSEKLSILLARPHTLLNKKPELIAKCLHRNKFKLIKFVT